MVWFRVDDKLHDHPKAQRAGCHAIGLWAMAGSWAADNLETYDGFVPDRIVPRFDPKWKQLARRLVDVGLWEPGQYDGEDGWWFHDWKDQNPSRAEVLTQRAAARERMARARANKPRSSREQPAEVPANGHRSSAEQSSELREVFALPRPDPTRPDPLDEESLRGERPETLRAIPATSPPQDDETCTRHPHGNPTDEPCRGCQRVEERKTRRVEQAAERAAHQAEERARNCPACEGTHFVLDDDKRPTGRRCNHRSTA